MSIQRIRDLADAVGSEFKNQRQVLSFAEWLAVAEAEPSVHLRSAAQYVRDALDHFGRRSVRTPSGERNRFVLFDRPFDEGHRLVGQEFAQNEIYEAIDGFCRLGRANRLLLLHGPNGSAKSTILECIQSGLEAYSHTPRGALYRFSWVFPSREPKGGGIGFGATSLRDAVGDESYAHLEAEAIDSRVADEAKDHPAFLIPIEQRQELLDELAPEEGAFAASHTIRTGDLSARNRTIYDALLTAYGGDLGRVLQHVVIERFFFSRMYRSALVDVEPKQTVDARSFPVTGDRAFASLPPSVAGQVLFGVQGDLVDANRGVLNFSDLLKRPYEHYKYLLTATEAGRVQLDHVVLNLDLLFTGSANDINLLEFRATRSAEYQSFRARLDLVPVPYLLDYRVERKIYQEQVGDLLRGIHIAPHVPRILALWGVMTRLRRPNPERYEPKLREVMGRLTPLEKADLYAYGRVPEGLSADEARELLAAVPAMHREPYSHAVVRAEGGEHLLGDYEGSFGASVRDLKGILLGAASRTETHAVTVPAVFAELREFMEDRNSHRWMVLEPSETGFHLLDGDDKSITARAYDRWIDLCDWEVREALGLVDEDRYLDLFRRYVLHVSHYLKDEKIFDPITGDSTPPDERFMVELEASMDGSASKDRKRFRAEVLSRIGAWALSHPNEEPAYDEIFPDYFSQLREDYFRKQKETVGRSIDSMLEQLSEKGRRKSSDEQDSDSLAQEERARIGTAIDRLTGQAPNSPREHHTRETLKETLVALSKARY